LHDSVPGAIDAAAQWRWSETETNGGSSWRDMSDAAEGEAGSLSQSGSDQGGERGKTRNGDRSQQRASPAVNRRNRESIVLEARRAGKKGR